MNKIRHQLLRIFKRENPPIDHVVGGRKLLLLRHKASWHTRKSWRRRKATTIMPAGVRGIQQFRGIIHITNILGRMSRMVAQGETALKISIGRIMILDIIHIAVIAGIRFFFFRDAIFQQRTHHPHLLLELGDARIRPFPGPPSLRRHEDAGSLALSASLTLIRCGWAGETADFETSARLARSI